jgi:hypothetical protein
MLEFLITEHQTGTRHGPTPLAMGNSNMLGVRYYYGHGELRARQAKECVQCHLLSSNTEQSNRKQNT